jgi:hypothetical protein
MARVTLTAKAALGPFGAYSVANSADLTMTAANISDKNQVACSGNDLIIAHNTGAGAHTITITSYTDPYNRTGDITAYSLGAGEYAIFGPFKALGWQQADGKIYFEANDAEVKFGVVAL